jgi:hypothetical protein
MGLLPITARTQNWCRENLPEFWGKELWPPNSPDHNPLDYFVRGVSELHVNKNASQHFSLSDGEITEVIGTLDRDTVAKACKRFWSRIEAVVAADGYFIEKMHSQYVYLSFCFLNQ